MTNRAKYIVNVKFRNDSGTLYYKTYSYLSDKSYSEYDLVIVPARNTYKEVVVDSCELYSEPTNARKFVVGTLDDVIKKKETKEISNMNNKVLNNMFRKVDNVVWDLMSGQVGFKTSDGIVTLDLNDPTDTEAAQAEVSVNMFDEFGVAIPAFAQSIPVESITLGDLIYSSSGPLGWVVKKEGNTYKLMRPDGMRADWTPPKSKILDFDSGVMVLRNLMNMFSSGEGFGEFKDSLMPLMLMGGNDSEITSMIPILLMSQSFGTDNNMGQALLMSQMMGGDNDMLPLLMMMQGGDNNNIMQMMLMMKMMGGKTGGKGFFE